MFLKVVVDISEFWRKRAKESGSSLQMLGQLWFPLVGDKVGFLRY